MSVNQKPLRMTFRGTPYYIAQFVRSKQWFYTDEIHIVGFDETFPPMRLVNQASEYLSKM